MDEKIQSEVTVQEQSVPAPKTRFPFFWSVFFLLVGLLSGILIGNKNFLSFLPGLTPTIFPSPAPSPEPTTNLNNGNATDNGADCLYQGITYKNGETFPNKCNSCTCESGQVACTLMACQ